MITRVLERLTVEAATLFVNEAVSHRVSLLATDAWDGYRRLEKEYPHKFVDHHLGQYVVGTVHTNTIEGFWSHL